MSIGELALFVSIAGAVPYIKSIFAGETRPERATWFVWSIILAVSLWGYHGAGARDSIWFIVGDLVATSTIFIISLFKGQGGWSRLDFACMFGALLGLLLGLVTREPLTVFVGTIGADILGLIPTVRKALRDPMSESASVFMFSGASAAIGIVAVGAWDWQLLFYPIYLFLANWLTAQLIIVGQYHVRHAQKLRCTTKAIKAI